MERLARAAVLVLGLAPGLALGQGAEVAFGGLRQDTSLPVEITADSLAIDQADGTAIFTGNVLVAQGEMRLSADRIRVVYASDPEATGRVQELVATGGVTLVNGAEAAEAEEATYTVDEGSVVMTGEVLLTQGGKALAGERLVIDLTAGTGVMEGRVRTVFRPNNP